MAWSNHCCMAGLFADHVHRGMHRVQLYRQICHACAHGCWTLGLQCAILIFRIFDFRKHGSGGTSHRSRASECHGEPRSNIWSISVSFWGRAEVFQRLWGHLGDAGIWRRGICGYACACQEEACIVSYRTTCEGFRKREQEVDADTETMEIISRRLTLNPYYSSKQRSRCHGTNYGFEEGIPPFSPTKLCQNSHRYPSISRYLFERRPSPRSSAA